VQRDGQNCEDIVTRITSKFPEYREMNIKEFEPQFVNHIIKMNFFDKFEPNEDFCVICKYLIRFNSTGLIFKPVFIPAQKTS
jgi:hypothetical protein